MTQFAWRIDSENYLFTAGVRADNMPVRQFITQVCKRLDQYSETCSLEQLKSGAIPHCHLHSITKATKTQTKECTQLFDKLKDINTKLGSKAVSGQLPTQLSEDDVLQISLDNIEPRFRCFGYILDNIFHLIHLDPYHKVYK